MNTKGDRAALSGVRFRKMKAVFPRRFPETRCVWDYSELTIFFPTEILRLLRQS